MKKKTVFLLASVAMGAALVGGTFASWAVTDNADPFSIDISTGDVTTDQTEYVTLEWGSQQSMSNVANLALGTVRKAGVLDLRANTTSATQTNGTLSYLLTGGTHLSAKLHIDVYAGDLAATNGVVAEETLEGKTPLTFTNGECIVTVNKNVANIYTVVVYLDNATTAADLAEMEGEQVSVTFDWGAGTNVATTTTLYATGFAGTPNLYAWTGATQNAAFPGIPMKEVLAGSGVYTAEIPVSMQNVIFSYDDDYSDDFNRQQSGDIAVATSFATANMYTYDGTTGDAKGTFSTFNPSEVKVPTYYVIGDFTDPTWVALEENKMTAKAGTTDEFEGTVTLTSGQKIKVFEQLHNMYYGCDTTWTDCGFTLDTDGNLVVTTGGTYTVHIDLTPEGAGNYVDISLNQ